MIGYYVHHQGSGHLTRAGRIAAALPDQVTGLSSLPAPDPGPFAAWLRLPRDDQGGVPTDPTAGGMLHWVPTGDPGLRARMASVSAWIQRHRPAALVVDVSVEVALLARLHGVPVIVVALPGDRDDAVHQLAYGLADAVLACWPREVYAPAWLVPHAARTHYIGALSRYDDRGPASVDGRRRYGVVFGGTGDAGPHTAPAAGLPTDLDWELLLPGAAWRADPWPSLCGAEVVVTHAGQNALAEVAAAGRPAVVLPQPRPFQEQQRTAEALAVAGLAVVPERRPSPDEWLAALDHARDLGGSGWSRWSSGRGAARAAAIVTAVADRGR